MGARRLLLLVGLAALLSGCVTLKDPEASQEYTGDVAARLAPGQAVGQTFISRRARLSEIQLWLRQVQMPTAADPFLTVELYHTPNDPQPITRLRLAASEVASRFPVTIQLPIQPDSPGQAYYLRLSVTEGAYAVYGRGEDAYPHGELRLNGAAQPADAGFRLGYDYDRWAFLSDLGAALRSAWLGLPLLLVFWLPGRLLARLVEDQLTLDWGQRTAISVGLSLAVAPVTLVWTTWLGLRWSRVGVILIYLLLAGALLIHRRLERPMRRPRLDLISLGLAGVFLFSLGLRLVMTRDLAGPAWVDSAHHALLTRLTLEQGAYPASFAPYAQAEAIGYHLGFYSLSAAFTALSGLALPQALLLFGQVLNALSIFMIYLLTVTFTRDRLAGLAAALLVGVFSPMPAYYASWGRYTQLAGLIVLPAGMRLIQAAIQPARPSLRLTLAAGLACAGLFLIHYRVIVFLAALLIAYGLAEVIRQVDKRPAWRTLPRMLGRGALAAGCAVLLTLPQAWRVFTGLLAPRLAAGMPDPQPLASIPWGYLTPAEGRTVLILGLVGLVWSILRARWVGPLMALWTGLLYLSANQGALRLPILGGVNLTSVEIVLFVPLTILGGWLLADVLRLIGRQLPPPVRQVYWGLVPLAALGWSLAAAPRLLTVLNPTTFLIRQADLPAMTWVSQNVPGEATLLINPFAWGYGYYAGQDGGYYLSAYTGRQTQPPTVLYAQGQAAYVALVNQVCQQTLDHGKDAAGLHDLMAAQGIGYVYLGARGGTISPQTLRQSSLFELLYAQDGVYIFKAH